MNRQNESGDAAPSAQHVLRDRAASQCLLDSIVETTSPIVGKDFFRRLIELLATRLGVDTALITQCPEPNTEVAQTLAFWHHGGFEPDIEFCLAGTPCQQVIHDGQFRFLPEGVSQQFPDWDWSEDGIESFIGIPVLNPETGSVLGHIAVYDRKPMRRDAVAESMFRIVAMRAGAEILRRQAEQRRLEQEQLAQQRLHELAVVSRRASISEMTSAVTHEIRQPLTQIKTYIQSALRLLDHSDPDPEKLHLALEKALDGAQRGEDIINRLKQWMGQTEIVSESIDTRGLIEETGRLLSSELTRTGTALHLHTGEEPPGLVGDKVLLQQVVFNLLRNALEAIERGGSSGGEARIDVHLGRGRGGKVCIEISDTGQGVPDAMVEHIFEPFAGMGEKGMGIGLSLCRSIVESHGGQLELASACDPTVFRIALPASCGPLEP